MFSRKEEGERREQEGRRETVHISKGGSRGRKATFSKLGEEGERVR